MAGVPAGFYGQVTDADLNEQIVNIGLDLARHVRNVEGFTAAAVAGTGLKPSIFIKVSRVFKSLNDPGLIEDILNYCVRERVINSVTRIDQSGFMKICYWMKSPDGSRAVQHIQKVKKLQKKAPVGVDPRAAALAQGLVQQLQDLYAARKNIREKSNKRIDELRAKIMLMEREQELELPAVAKRYPRACNYQELPPAEFGEKCYAYYVDDAVLKNVTPAPKTKAGIKLAEKMFGEKVKAEAMALHCRDPGVQAELMNYISEKILMLDAVGNQKKANYFRAIMRGAGGVIPKSVPAIAAVGADEVHSGGQGLQAKDEGEEPAVDQPPPAPIAQPQNPARSQGSQGSRLGQVRSARGGHQYHTRQRPK